MQKLEDHTPIFVRIPNWLFDAARDEAMRRQVVLRVVITDALRERYEPIAPPSAPPPPSPSPSFSHGRGVMSVEERRARASEFTTRFKTGARVW